MLVSSKILTQSALLQNLGIPVIDLFAFKAMFIDIGLTIKINYCISSSKMDRCKLKTSLN